MIIFNQNKKGGTATKNNTSKVIKQKSSLIWVKLQI